MFATSTGMDAIHDAVRSCRSSIEQAEQWVIAFHSQSGLPTAEITDTETYDDGYRDSPVSYGIPSRG